MKRTIRVETTKCKRCGAEMCEAHLSAELGIAARCRIQNLGHLCGRCGQKHIDDAVAKLANRVVARGSVVGVVVDEGNLRQILVRTRRRHLTIHAARGGALVVSEDRTWH